MATWLHAPRLRARICACVPSTSKALHPKKAFLPMVAKLAGRVMVVRELQPSKAFIPMVARLAGRVMVVRERQPEKAKLLMVARPAGRG